MGENKGEVERGEISLMKKDGRLEYELGSPQKEVGEWDPELRAGC